MKANSISELFHENLLTWGMDANVDYIVTVETDPLVLYSPSLQHMDGCSFQLITADYVRTVVVELTDSVDESSKTWIFANGAFTDDDIGATFVVAGADDPGNNGTFTVASVTDAETVVSVEAPGADETFASGDVTMVITDVAGAGDWLIEVSNDYVNPRLPGLNQVANAGHWTDITIEFAPAIAAVTAASNQYVQAYPLPAAFLRVTFTPSAGVAAVTVTYCAKGNR